MPPRALKGSVRRSQLITTYGVGAIIAVEDESVMVTGIDRWGIDDPNIHEPRLERELNVRGFVLPPATDDGPDIPAVRFPVWCSCPVCERLDRHKFFTSFDRNRCGTCDAPLIPSRFVVACGHGHIDDFPYFRWVHAGLPRSQEDHTMSIRAGGASASLRDIEISCTCGASMTMEGAFGRHALREVGARCTGKRPWLTGAVEDCDELPRALQRGASNVWFPVVRSALSIPPWSEGAFGVLNRYWGVLRHTPTDALAPTITGMDLTRNTSYSIDDLVAAVTLRKEREANPPDPTGREPLKNEEYEALIKGREESSGKQDFVCMPASGVGDLAKTWFPQVMVVKRLREVRVLESFTRILPPSPSDAADRRAPLYDAPPGWLPAIEVTGEGVFLRLDPSRLNQWEASENISRRVKKIDDNYVARFTERGDVPDRKITPRLILIHTLAHALINQWSLDSGYPAASLRERLHVSDVMAGLLLYTATTDSAGSLGGVVAQAEDGRLGETLVNALTAASWCSADPLCIEAGTQGVDSLNLAACHACILLPEVSCEEMNQLLDRALLIGIPEDPTLGYFAPMLVGV